MCLFDGQRLKLPLVTNFQDWWPHNQYWSESERPFPPVRRLIESRFRRMYAASDLAFLYKRRDEGIPGASPQRSDAVSLPGQCPDKCAFAASEPHGSKPLRLVYAGTITGDYGRSVLSLARQLADSSKFQFLVYGPSPDWNNADVSWAKAKGIYQGFISHEQLRSVFASADVFLTVMSFEQCF